MNSALVSVGQENLTQERGINKGYAVEVYDEIAFASRRLCQSRTHGREIIFGPVADELDDLRRTALIVVQARFREPRRRRLVEGALRR